MFTDVIFTNPGLDARASIGFYQSHSGPGNLFRIIRECPGLWSHRFRIPWKLGFRFVKPSGSIGPYYPLKASCRTEKMQYLISRDGTMTVQESYGNGRHIFDFHQAKGNAYSGVRLYRGNLLIAERQLIAGSARLETDHLITAMLISPNENSISGRDPMSITVDITGLRSIHLSCDMRDGKPIVSHVQRW